MNVTGGFAELGGAEKPIRVIGRLGPRPEQVVADLKLVVVKPPEPGKAAERTVLLEDVARVVEGAQVKRGDASINGHPGVVITVAKQPHADTRALTDEVKAALARGRAVAARRRGASTPTCSSSASSSTAASTTSARRSSSGPCWC